MRISTLAVALGSLLGMLCGKCDEAHQLTRPKQVVLPDSEKELHEIMRNTCEAVNRFYSAEGFPLLTVGFSSLTQCYEDFHVYKKQVLVLQTNREFDGPRIEILPDSRRVFYFTNWQAFNAATHAPPSATRLPPKWMKGHAIAVGRKFADIFVAPWRTHLVVNYPMTDFSWLWQDVDPKTNSEIIRPGQWTIRWQRATPSGIPYESDMVIVEETEANGPLSACVYFSTEYDENQSEKTIPQDLALGEAAKGRDAALIENPLPGANLVKVPPVIRLMVVSNADGINPLKSFPNPGFFSESKGRLAWRVNYQITTSERYLAGDLIVYVDALDGKILGCFYPQAML
jgi:hypothetical protein